MSRPPRAPRRDPRPGLPELRNRLHAAEETLRAIRAGEVDAVIVSRAGKDQVVTLAGTELAYRICFDQMSEGAVTLTGEGVIASCNRRFAELVRAPMAALIGTPLRRFVPPAQLPAFDALLEAGQRESRREDGTLRGQDGSVVPVSISLAPLQLEGSAEVIGVIGVVTDISERRQAEELRDQLIEQAMTAQAEERKRIAYELHDETGQSLTALLVGLRTIEQSTTIGRVTELAERLRGIAAQTLDDVGRLSRGLHPGILDDLGLAAAVTRHALQFAELHGIAVDVRTEGLDGEPLPPLLQSTVYRVVQETLTNVAKHASARNAIVRLVRREATVELRVQDDGAGLDPRARADLAAGERPRLGLQGVRERVALLGGSLRIDSKPGEGTTVSVRFHLRGRLAPAPAVPRAGRVRAR